MEKRIGFKKRFLATAVDYFIITLLTTIFGMGLYKFLQQPNMSTDILLSLAFSICFLIFSVVFILWERLTGKSLGKQFFKIKISNVDGTITSKNRLLLRSFIKNGYTIIIVATFWCMIFEAIQGPWVSPTEKKCDGPRFWKNYC